MKRLGSTAVGPMLWGEIILDFLKNTRLVKLQHPSPREALINTEIEQYWLLKITIMKNT